MISSLNANIKTEKLIKVIITNGYVFANSVLFIDSVETNDL